MSDHPPSSERLPVMQSRFSVRIVAATALLLCIRISPRNIQRSHPPPPGPVRYELRLRGGDVVVFHKDQGFRDLGHGSATRVNADQGIRVKIYGNLWVNLEYDLRYNSQPVEARKTTDTNVILGLSYDIKP